MTPGPGMCLARVLTCGRNWEYLGEDPYLARCTAATPVRQLGHAPRPAAGSEAHRTVLHGWKSHF